MKLAAGLCALDDLPVAFTSDPPHFADYWLAELLCERVGRLERSLCDDENVLCSEQQNASYCLRASTGRCNCWASWGQHGDEFVVHMHLHDLGFFMKLLLPFTNIFYIWVFLVTGMMLPYGRI